MKSLNFQPLRPYLPVGTRYYFIMVGTVPPVERSNTGRIINFKVILKIVRKGFLSIRYFSS